MSQDKKDDGETPKEPPKMECPGSGEGPMMAHKEIWVWEEVEGKKVWTDNVVCLRCNRIRFNARKEHPDAPSQHST